MTNLEFATAAGDGETGWRRREVCRSLIHFNKWEGAYATLGIHVVESRTRMIPLRLGEKILAKERDAQEKALRRCVKEMANLKKHHKAIRTRTASDVDWLASCGIVVKVNRPGKVPLIHRAPKVTYLEPTKDRLGMFSFPAEVFDRITTRQDLGSKNRPDPGGSIVQILAGHRPDPGGSLYKEYLVKYLDQKSRSSSFSKEKEPPPSRASDSNPLPKASPMTLLDLLPTDIPRQNPLAFLNAPGVPPYPGADRVGLVDIPGPPVVLETMGRTERIEFLVTVYRSAIREFYRRTNDGKWTPPRVGFWPRQPKPPKAGKDPTPAAIRYLECAKRFEKAGLRPHVWCMHMAHAWVEINGRGLDKPPPIKYVYNPTLITSKRGWIRGMSDDYACARREMSPRARELERDWRKMSDAFLMRRVSSEEQAVEVAAQFFPADEWNNRVAAAQEEATAMTEMYSEHVANGDWVWQ